MTFNLTLKKKYNKVWYLQKLLCLHKENAINSKNVCKYIYEIYKDTK